MLCMARAMPPSLVWELGSKKASSTRELVLRHCVHNKRCNVLRYLYCDYGVSSPLCKTFGERRSEHRASQALQRAFEKTNLSKRLLGGGWAAHIGSGTGDGQ